MTFHPYRRLTIVAAALMFNMPLTHHVISQDDAARIAAIFTDLEKDFKGSNDDKVTAIEKDLGMCSAWMRGGV
jgi:hypothetical protein